MPCDRTVRVWPSEKSRQVVEKHIDTVFQVVGGVI